MDIKFLLNFDSAGTYQGFLYKIEDMEDYLEETSTSDSVRNNTYSYTDISPGLYDFRVYLSDEMGYGRISKNAGSDDNKSNYYIFKPVQEHFSLEFLNASDNHSSFNGGR